MGPETPFSTLPTISLSGEALTHDGVTGIGKHYLVDSGSDSNVILTIEFSDEQEFLADMDSDGTVNVLDIIQLVNIILN